MRESMRTRGRRAVPRGAQGPPAQPVRGVRLRVGFPVVSLPLQPPIEPQLAKSAKELPIGDGWVYEQKWDGFRVIAFVDGDEVYLQSRGSKPLDRYFPEIELPAGRYVLDGEIVILDADGRPAFGALQQRIHPAESRIQRLSQETPATLLPFDLLADGDESCSAALRRAARAAREPAGRRARAHDGDARRGRRRGLARHGRRRDREGARRAVPARQAGRHVKIKRNRTIDCVVIGYREGEEPETVGSLHPGAHRRRRPAGADGALVRLLGQAEAVAAREVRPYETGERGTGERHRAGRRGASWSGSGCGPSSWSRCPSTTPRAAASGTARGCTGSGTTSGPTSACWPTSRPPRPPA